MLRFSNTFEPPRSLQELLWHSGSDSSVKPIVLNKRIEKQAEPRYEPKALPFAAQVREHSSAVELCGPHVAISPAMLRSSNAQSAAAASLGGA